MRSGGTRHGGRCTGSWINPPRNTSCPHPTGRSRGLSRSACRIGVAGSRGSAWCVGSAGSAGRRGRSRPDGDRGGSGAGWSRGGCGPGGRCQRRPGGRWRRGGRGTCSRGTCDHRKQGTRQGDGRGRGRGCRGAGRGVTPMPGWTVFIAPVGFLPPGNALAGAGRSERSSRSGRGSLHRRVLGRGNCIVGQGCLDAGGKNQYRSDGRCCGAASDSPMDTGPGQ